MVLVTDLHLSLGTTSASFTGTLDLSGATVTGLPAGAAGLVSGTGTDSMKNADSLVTTPATADFQYNIALGNAAQATVPFSGAATPTDNIALGNNARNITVTGAANYKGRSIAIGLDAYTCDTNDALNAINGGNIAIGTFSKAEGRWSGVSTAIGMCASAIGGSGNGTAIGYRACTNGSGTSLGMETQSVSAF